MIVLTAYRRYAIEHLSCLTASLMIVQSALAQGVSEAEILLFQTPHLQNIHQAVALTYSYKKTSLAEPSVKDEVKVKLNKIHADKSANVTTHFLNAERHIAIPDLENAQENPVLLGFLEHDIAEMNRLTHGSPNYFRKRIRLALADTAQVRPVQFSYQGKQLSGQEVRFQPYLNDPMRAKFAQYANKSYVFVISDQIAGGVYQIHTAVPDEKNGTAILEETLTLEKSGKS